MAGRGLTDQVEELRKQLLRKTVIIFGLQETAQESLQDLEGKVKAMAQKMGMAELDIDYVRRFGRPVPGKTRPIELTLLRTRDAFRILQAKSQLRNEPTMKNVFIDPARTPQEIQIYRKLQKFARDHKKFIDRNAKFRIRNGILQLESRDGGGCYYVTKDGKVQKLPEDTKMNNGNTSELSVEAVVPSVRVAP